jgi:hypothetical protein
MGKSKDPILKIKTQDFKKLSQQFEQEAKRESEKKKLANKKRRAELIEKIEIEGRNKSLDDSRTMVRDSPRPNGNFHLRNPIEKNKMVNLL